MGQVFQVLTQFEFDASGAVANSKVLESAVDGVSSAADRALGSLQRLAIGATAALGLTSALGLLKSAVGVSERFHTAALDFSTVIATNMQYLSGSVGSFNDRLGATQTIMQEIGKTADQLDLSRGDLFSIVKASIPQLAPHGAAGTNFKNAIGLSSQALVAGSNLGIDPREISQQLAAALAGTAENGGLMGRLLGTKALKGAGGVDGFNAENFDERLKLLSAGLQELGGDMGYVSERANSITTQFKRLKELMMGDENGMGSILKPLGDALRMPLVNMLKGVNGYIKNEGAQIVGNMSQLVKSMISTPEKMLVDLMQLRHLKSDVKEAGSMLGTIGAVTGVGTALSWLTGKAIFAAPGIGLLTGALLMFGSAMRRSNDVISQTVMKFAEFSAFAIVGVGILAKFGVLWEVLGFVLTKVIAPLALMTTLLQALSRAQAQAHVDDAKDLAEMMPHLSELFVRVKMAVHNLLAPLNDIIQGWANIFEPIFRWSGWLKFIMPLLDALVVLLEVFGDAVLGIMAIISGVITTVIGMVDNIVSLKNPFSGMGDNFKNGFDDYVKGHLQKFDQGGNVSNQVTNIGRVEIKNDFKETQEPDRIAFTMKEQILKAAQNPKQARGRASQLGFATR